MWLWWQQASRPCGTGGTGGRIMAIQARDDDHTSKDGCGKPDGAAAVELADIAAGQGGGFALNGAGADDFSGLSVSRAGDVDGDGLADLIVGAPFANLIVGA